MIGHHRMNILQLMSGMLWSPVLIVANTRHRHYHCTLPADDAESWMTVAFPNEPHGAERNTFYFLRLNQSGSFYTCSLCLATAFCSSLVLSSLSDSHGRLPVYVGRASSQSAVKAVILLVAIYYPVVCLKKDWKRAELGAGCWVSRHAKLQSESTTDLTYVFALELVKVCAYACVMLFFVLFEIQCALGEVFISCVSQSAAGFARYLFFPLSPRTGMCRSASFEDNKAAWGGCV